MILVSPVPPHWKKNTETDIPCVSQEQALSIPGVLREHLWYSLCEVIITPVIAYLASSAKRCPRWSSTLTRRKYCWGWEVAGVTLPPKASVWNRAALLDPAGLIHQLHSFLDKKDLDTVTRAQLNYWNALDVGLTLKTIWKLQLVQNAADWYVQIASCDSCFAGVILAPSAFPVPIQGSVCYV